MNKMEDVAKETLEVLNYFDFNFLSKIPRNFLEKLKKISETSNILVSIDKSKKLFEQDISEECKELISLIYYNYIADKNDKKDILKCWIINEEKYQEELREKYNPNNVFKNKKESSPKVKQSTSQENKLIEYKAPLYKRIFSKILNILK